MHPAGDLIKQRRQHQTIVDTIFRNFYGHDFFCCLVNAQMQFTPGSSTTGAMLLDMPLTGAVDLEPGRINHDVSGSFPGGQRYGKRALPPAHGTVVGHRELKIHGPDHGVEKTLCRPEAEMEHGLQHQSALNRGVRVNPRCARSNALLRVSPPRDGVFIEPERQSASRDESPIVIAPISDTIPKYIEVIS